MEKQEYLIVGAGIGGLAVGAAFRNLGFDFTIYENAHEVRHGGAGIAIWANALHALKVLGLRETPAYFKTGHTAVAVRKSDGRTITSADADELAARYGELSAVLHRQDLHNLLWDLAGRPEVQCGKKLHHYEHVVIDGQKQVRIFFEDGSSAQGVALIGCDGIHSAVRRQIVGDEAPRYAGYTAWRGISHLHQKDLAPGESWGRGARFGYCPLHDGRAYWFATRNAPEGATYEGDVKENLLSWFGDWHAPIADLIRETPTTEILHNDLFDRDPVVKWCDQNVIMLGDAAHPTTPNLGQGGCMAIEDAVALGKSLSTIPVIEDAFKACNASRYARTASLVLKARRIGSVGQWSWAPAVAVRDYLMRTLGSRMQMRELDALIGYRV